jgi:hypothetical protein
MQSAQKNFSSVNPPNLTLMLATLKQKTGKLLRQCLFLKLIFIVIPMGLFAQARPLNYMLLRKLKAPTQQVKVVNDHATVQEIAANQVVVTKNSALTVTYADKIARPDAEVKEQLASKKKIIGNLTPNFDLSRFRVIPELHVETEANGAQKAYSIMFTSIQHLQYNFDSAFFSSTVSFLLVEEALDDSSGSIKNPVSLEVTSDAKHEIRPKAFQINHVSIPSSDISVVCRNVQDSADVRVITKSNPRGYTTFLKIDPALEITPNLETVQGYGIQEIPLTVRFIGTTSKDSVMVSLVTDKGTLSPNPVRMTYNQPAIVMLRTEGTGQAMVSAKSTRAASNVAVFHYSFPWIFIIASIVGGLVGGLIKFYFFSNKKKVLKPVVGSILIGILGAAAYFVLGINLLHFQASHNFSEFAVFGFSGLCAVFGIRLKDE